MAYNISVARESGIVIATIDRPAKLNSLNKETFEELARLVDVLETDKKARVLIITGEGNKAFCIGADLKERQGMNEKDVLFRLEYAQKLFVRLEQLPIPVIAAINGPALAEGFELALACDLRVASQNAVVGFPDVELALIPSLGGTQRLGRLVGVAKAMELILLAGRLTAEEAKELGLISEVVEKDKTLEKAREWSRKMMEAGPIAIRQAKVAIRKGADYSLSEGLRIEREAYKPCLYSQDRMEGLKAFTEKRKPNFTGA